MTKPLRAVGPDEKSVPERKLSITEAASSGTIRQQLCALRDRVVKTVEDPNCPARELASLSKRLMEITKEIDAIDVRDLEDSGGAGAATPDEDWEAV